MEFASTLPLTVKTNDDYLWSHAGDRVNDEIFALC